jgi:hypothetical protein
MPRRAVAWSRASAIDAWSRMSAINVARVVNDALSLGDGVTAFPTPRYL